MIAGVQYLFYDVAEILVCSLANFHHQLVDTHKFQIFAMHQRMRVDNLAIFHRKKQVDVCFC